MRATNPPGDELALGGPCRAQHHHFFQRPDGSALSPWRAAVGGAPYGFGSGACSAAAPSLMGALVAPTRLLVASKSTRSSARSADEEHVEDDSVGLDGDEDGEYGVKVH